MTKKFIALLALAAAAGISARAWTPVGAVERSTQSVAFDRSALASQELPDGLVLPGADVNLRIASLVTADLDADGDLDVFATENSSGSVNLVVWVNDGAGRLARKEPRKAANSGVTPASSSVSDSQSNAFVTIQSDGYAMESIAVSPWLSLRSQSHRLARSTGPTSASPSTLRSRSPPASLRLS